MTGTGENICATGDLINQYCGSHLKYHVLEVESLREVYKTRDQLYSQYVKKEGQLMLKKENLFKLKNPQKW